MGLCYVYEAMIGNVSWEGVYLIVLYTVLNGKKLQVTQLLTLGVRWQTFRKHLKVLNIWDEYHLQQSTQNCIAILSWTGEASTQLTLINGY
jgi:hypothetical protein